MKSGKKWKWRVCHVSMSACVHLRRVCVYRYAWVSYPRMLHAVRPCAVSREAGYHLIASISSDPTYNSDPDRAGGSRAS